MAKYIKFRETTKEPTTTTGDATLWIRPTEQDLYFEGTRFACLTNDVRTYINSKYQAEINSKFTFASDGQSPSSSTAWTSGASISITCNFHLNFDNSKITSGFTITCASGETITNNSGTLSLTTKTTANANGNCSKTLTFNATYKHPTYGSISKTFSMYVGCYAPTYIFMNAAATGNNITAATITGDSTKQTLVRSGITGTYNDIMAKAGKYVWFAFPSFLLSNGASTKLTWKQGGFDFPMEDFYSTPLKVNNVTYYLIRKSDMPAIDNEIDGLVIS